MLLQMITRITSRLYFILIKVNTSNHVIKVQELVI